MERRTISSVHTSPHVFDSLGTAHGPVDARLPRRTSRYVDYEAPYSSPRTEHARGDREGQECTGWAQFWAHSRFINLQQCRESRRNQLRLKEIVARPERLELPTYWFEANRSIQLSYGRVRFIVSSQQQGQTATTVKSKSSSNTAAPPEARALSSKPA